MSTLASGEPEKVAGAIQHIVAGEASTRLELQGWERTINKVWLDYQPRLLIRGDSQICLDGFEMDEEERKRAEANAARSQAEPKRERDDAAKVQRCGLLTRPRDCTADPGCTRDPGYRHCYPRNR